MEQQQFIATGIAYFPNLRTPDYYNGTNQGFVVHLNMPDDQFTALGNQLMEIIKEEAPKKFPGKTFNDPKIPLATMKKDGTKLVKFKSKSEYVRNGQIIQRKINIYDKFGKELDESIDIGTGSKIRINFTPNVFYASPASHGVTLRINAVQVLELVPKGTRTAASYGFDCEPQPDPLEIPRDQDDCQDTDDFLNAPLYEE